MMLSVMGWAADVHCVTALWAQAPQPDGGNRHSTMEAEAARSTAEAALETCSAHCCPRLGKGGDVMADDAARQRYQQQGQLITYAVCSAPEVHSYSAFLAQGFGVLEAADAARWRLKQRAAPLLKQFSSLHGIANAAYFE